MVWKMCLSLNLIYFVADKNNHCIRKVDLLNAYVTTYAGLCGEEGFLDGPFEINRLSYPDNIGVDLDGNIFVYDSGNKFVRMIDPLGNIDNIFI